MPRLQLICSYSLTDRKNFRISPALAGTEIRIPKHGLEVVIHFPPWVGWGRSDYIGMSGDPEMPLDLSLRSISTTVDFNVAEGLSTEDLLREVKRIERIAQEAVSQFKSWVHLHQPWIDHPATLSRWTHPAAIKDLATGELLPISPLSSITDVLVVSEAHLTPSEAALIPNDLPDDADVFMAEAKRLAYWTDIPLDRQAILMGAVAAEVKAKRVLLELASPEAKPLLELVFNEPRSFGRPAFELYHQLARSVAGRSFKDDHPETFKALNHLFQFRNQIAHTGTWARPNTIMLRTLIEAASAACEWIAEIRIGRWNV